MTKGALEGLKFCGDILIPSLFPFMVLSSLIVRCGLSDKVSKILDFIMNKLFRLSGACGISFLLSMLGGYPVGARGIIALLEKGNISKKQAECMALFMVGGGPAFIVFVVGDELLKDRTLGLILWGCQLISQIVLSVAVSRIWGVKNDTENRIIKTEKTSFSYALVQSCGDGAAGIINMCAMVVLFSALLGIINSIGLSELITDVLLFYGVSSPAAHSLFPVLWEVTSGCDICADTGAGVILFAFAIGWGGVCVHFQVFSVLGGLSFSKLKFFLCRFCQGAISAVLTYIALLFYTPSTQVFSNLNRPAEIHGSAETHIGSIALFFMCVIFLISAKLVPKRENVSRK